jgi:hypothetical protein
VLQFTSDGMADQNAAFIHEDGDKRLPTPVYSSVTPGSPVGFLLHVMLVCGNFETKLDFRTAPSMRESLRAANLIGIRTDNDSLPGIFLAADSAGDKRHPARATYIPETLG